jgi:hypothetical protein
VAATVTALAAASLFSWNRITDAGIRHINGTHVRVGKWLAASLPPGTPVASFDIGGIAYFSRMRLIDLGGLTDPHFLPYLHSHQSSVYLREHGIRWVVLPTTVRDGDSPLRSSCDGFAKILALCDGTHIEKREILSFSSSRDLWELGFRATDHATQSQALFEVTWR